MGSCPLLLMRIVRITKGCRTWWTSSKPRSNHTRSKLKKLKKLLLLTWLNSAKFKPTCLRPVRLLTLTNKPLEKPSVDVPLPWDPIKCLMNQIFLVLLRISVWILYSVASSFSPLPAFFHVINEKNLPSPARLLHPTDRYY